MIPTQVAERLDKHVAASGDGELRRSLRADVFGQAADALGKFEGLARAVHGCGLEIMAVLPFVRSLRDGAG